MHIPVLLQEVLASLDPQSNLTYVDATFGGGGYTEAILHAAPCSVVALDRDPEAEVRAQRFKATYPERFRFVLTPFGVLEEVLLSFPDFQAQWGGIAFDFGVSSFQLDEASRGFSFQKEGPLDMRMGASGLTAEEVVNTFSQQDLAEILRVYGEEPQAAKISRAITTRRKQTPLRTTLDLAEVVHSVVPRIGPLDPATKTFQAIRIFVNDELREIQKALDGVAALAVRWKLPALKVVTVAFHSLEDRIVKNWIRTVSQQCPELKASPVSSHVLAPSEEELKANARSRSGKLRAVTLSFEGAEGL